ncbi:MAG: membrane dipeptidase [candidate division Zixibacteria bacterium]|nr:membrane dipeptidase [candidate division Zixibacteria bacterium]
MSCRGLNHDYMSTHKKAFVADMHCDTVLRMMKGFDIASDDTSSHMGIPRMQQGGIDLQVFACWLDTDTPVEQCRSTVDEMIDTLEAQISRNPESIALCHSADEAEKNEAGGKISAVLAIENGVAIANDLANLDHFYNRGIRYMTLTHTASNDWCISSADTNQAFHGLTDFGRDVIKKMNKLGMIVDVSHASVSAFEEVMKITTDPVIASHSCVYNLCPHDRNLTDEQIKVIAKNGGLIGINFYNGYLSTRWMEVDDSIDTFYSDEIDEAYRLYPISRKKRKEFIPHVYKAWREAIAKVEVNVGTVVDHIDYIVKLVGPDYVGLGSDYDGVHRLPDGLDDCSMVPNITAELLLRGYSEGDIRKILGGNFRRVFKQVCG